MAYLGRFFRTACIGVAAFVALSFGALCSTVFAAPHDPPPNLCLAYDQVVREINADFVEPTLAASDAFRQRGLTHDLFSIASGFSITSCTLRE